MTLTLALPITTHRLLEYPITLWPTTARLDRPDEQERFFAAIIEQGGVKQACEALNLHRPTVYIKRRSDKSFATRFDAAKECLADMLYDECMEIADSAEGKDDWCAKKLQIETRMRVAGKLKPDTNITFNDNRQVIVTQEKREQLQATLLRIQNGVASSPGHRG